MIAPIAPETAGNRAQNAGSPRISILLPVFMRRPSAESLSQLERAIASVLNQSYPAGYELLLIDDGSPVALADHLARLPHHESPALRILRSGRNTGLVHALNLGLQQARFEWIARIDADDAWQPGKIERQIARLAGDPDLTIIGTGMTMHFGKSRRTETKNRPDGWGAILKFSRDIGCPFPHGSILARADIYRLLGGYPQAADVAHCEDYALWSVWLRFFKPAMIESALYDYLVSAASISVRHRRQQLMATLSIRDGHRRLNIGDRLSEWMSELAGILNISPIQAGVLCYRIWALRPTLRLPAEALSPLRNILPDRQIARSDGAHQDEPLDVPELLDGFGPPASEGARALATLAVL
jgi:glycosyltransferase involved in cell wall biosynthesis